MNQDVIGDVKTNRHCGAWNFIVFIWQSKDVESSILLTYTVCYKYVFGWIVVVLCCCSIIKWRQYILTWYNTLVEMFVKIKIKIKRDKESVSYRENPHLESNLTSIKVDKIIYKRFEYLKKINFDAKILMGTLTWKDEWTIYNDSTWLIFSYWKITTSSQNHGW